jgi:hypothetical protein
MGWLDDDRLTRPPDFARDGVPIKRISGMEIRGLLALMIKRIDVERSCDLVRGYSIVPTEIFAVHIQWQVPSVNGGDWITLQFHSREVTHPRWSRDADGRELTPEQAAIRAALHSLWNHEWDESLAIDGVPLEHPGNIHA